ncbi:glycosyltransferase family 2 protein [Porticoccaceae bacterium]|nr:glycosyltransferase family 2 protein [Porticoccaceae bacterium]
MNSLKEVGAVIVTFNPGGDFLTTLNSIATQVVKVVIVDNGSSEDTISRIKKYGMLSDNVFLIENHNNFGIAKALNIGCKYLLSQNILFGVLLDQDSVVTPSMVDLLHEYAISNKNCGIVGPLIIPQNLDIEKIRPRLKFVNKKSAFIFARIHPSATPFKVAFNITSGSLCNLNIWKELGGFWEELFIDGVDNEYGLRLLSHGYETYIHPDAALCQTYGEQRLVRVLGRDFFPTFHSDKRRYYASRNRILIWRRYALKQPFYLFWDFLSFTNTIMVIICCEDRKLAKMYYMLIGMRDGLLGKTGKFLV